MSWIGRDEIASIIEFVLRTETLYGPVNAVSPSPLRSAEFAAVATQATAQNTYQQQIIRQLSEAAGRVQSLGYAADGAPAMGSLNDDASEGVLVQLNGGMRYAILGVCDNDCTDVDLRVYDPFGNMLGEDILVDDHPVVEFTAGSTGQFRVNVMMATCNTNPCYYGVQVYARGGGGGGK